MKIKKRVWNNGKDISWIVQYQYYCPEKKEHVRAIETFRKKSDAENKAAQIKVNTLKGMHVAPSRSITVQEAGEAWLAACRVGGLEESTLDGYDEHVRLHIVPFIGGVKLAHITVPLIRQFQEQLREKGRSSQMVKGATGDLGRILSHAQEHGLAAHNAVRELTRGRRKGGATANRKRALEVGVDIPTPAEVRAILAAAKGRWKPLLMTAALTGLRASELRGLRWDDVDLTRGELRVRQRADKYCKIGPPKSAAGRRTVPLTPGLAQELRLWRLQCPRLKQGADDKEGKLGLVFPNGQGKVEGLGNIRKRGLVPAMLTAGVTTPLLDENGVQKRDEDGKPLVEPKFTGMHAFRHFYASWLINRKADGGRELPLKAVQALLGHASPIMTLTTYAHLFPTINDGAELEAAEKALLGA